MKLKPFQALRPPPELARAVASVPYDTVDTEEARALAAGNPMSFLRIGRPEIDLPRGTDIYSDAVYARAAANFREFQEKGYLVREEASHLYVYRLQMGQHVQHGMVGCCHIEDYENNIIRKHEKTRADKEDDRTRHVKTLNANSGPIFLTYRDVPALDRIVAETEKGKPLFDFTAVDGIRHVLWRIPSGDSVVNAFAQVPVSYIADGHHRAAAAVRAGQERRAANPRHTGNEEYNWFLAVLFPAGQLQILPYNRCVNDLNGLSREGFLDAVKKSFDLTEPAAATPPGARHCSMYLAGKWYGLSWTVGANDPVAALDVSFLQDRLLSPILGIRDPRTDKRIEFIGGIRGTGELVKRVDLGKAAVAFSMYPVTVDQVMAIADAGRIMPPKSTWFEPKLRSGILVHTL